MKLWAWLAVGGVVSLIAVRTFARTSGGPTTPAEPIGIYGMRRLPEGYIVGPMPGLNDIDILHSKGIRTVISLVRPPEAVTNRINSRGMRHVIAPMGNTFRDRHFQAAQIAKQHPSETFIHCTHGADRTGAMVAYLLVRNHGWTPREAFWSVVNDADVDTEGLRAIIGDQNPSKPTFGYYSYKVFGRSGGMKVRNEGYRTTVTSTLEYMRRR